MKRVGNDHESQGSIVFQAAGILTKVQVTAFAMIEQSFGRLVVGWLVWIPHSWSLTSTPFQKNP